MATRWRVLNQRRRRKIRIEQEIGGYNWSMARYAELGLGHYDDGYPEYGDDYSDDEGCDGSCWHCGGDGFVDGYEDDPLWFAPGEMERCSSCGGSGRAKDMTIW